MKFPIFLFFAVFSAKTASAQIQFVNNSPDPLMSPVKIMSGGRTLVASLAYRQATAFIPADLDLGDSIAIISVQQPATKQSFVFTANASSPSRVIIQGVSDAAKFAANPDGRDIGLMIVAQNVKVQPDSPTETDVAITFGSTDTPPCSLTAVDVAPLLQNGSFGDVTPFTLPMPSTTYYCNLIEMASVPVVRRIFEVNLGAAQGKCALLLLSGFWNPAANGNGKPVALLLILPDGTVEECSAVITGVEEAPFGGTRRIAPVFDAKAEKIIWQPDDAILQAAMYANDGRLVARTQSVDEISTSSMPNGGYLIHWTHMNGISGISKILLCR